MGSTDLRPPFDYVANNGIEPDVFLYFTDLGGPKPETEPSYPVIWLDQDDCPEMMRCYGAPWGRHIGMRG
jgi:predicted metal-dependent peptidase